MREFIKISYKPFVIGIIAALLGLVDSFIAPLFEKNSSFIWVAFISWTVFFSSNLKERIKAVLGIIIGFLAANLIVIISTNISNYISISIIASMLAIFIVNALVMYFENLKKLYLDSIPGIFVGILTTFSGAGIGLSIHDINLFLIIIIYGILGLICGYFSIYFINKKRVN